MTDQPSEPNAAGRCGFVALIGQPNAGKSTLLNRILGQKLAITSSKPQTTRNRIMGIHNAPGLQAVLVDTPGIHKAKSRVNRALVQTARQALNDVDAVCWVIDVVKPVEMAKKGRNPIGFGHKKIAEVISNMGREVGLTLVLNKVDKVDKRWLLPVMASFAEHFPNGTIVPLSALKGGGVEQLEDVWRAQLPIRSPMFDKDQLTDMSERFLVSELVREKVFRCTHQEVPYSSAVEVEKFEEERREDDGGGKVVIYARIFVESDSQQGIIIGKGGQMLKRIGTDARKDIQAMLGVAVHLDLHVSVKKQWTRKPHVLREWGIE